MPVLGLTKLEAVNRMLMTRGLDRVAALDPGGTSDAAEAEYVLDLVTTRELRKGWPCNTHRFQTLTASGSPMRIQVSSNTLAVVAAGVDEGRAISLQGDYLYDIRKGTTTFGTSETVVIHRIYDLAFEDIDPGLKEQIALVATQEYIAMRFPEQNLLAYTNAISNAHDVTLTRVNSGEPSQVNQPQSQPVFAMTQPRQQQ